MNELDTGYHMARLQRRLADPVFAANYQAAFEAMTKQPINRAARRKLMRDTVGFGNFFQRQVRRQVWHD